MKINIVTGLCMAMVASSSMASPAVEMLSTFGMDSRTNSQGMVSKKKVEKTSCVDEEALKQLIGRLKDNKYYTDLLNQVQGETNEKKKAEKLGQLYDDVAEVSYIQDQIIWLNLTSVNLAYDDMKKQKGFDVAKYEPMMKELTALVK